MARPPKNTWAKSKWAFGVSLLLLAAVGGGAYWYVYLRGTVYSDDARIAGDLVDLAPELGSRLERVYVREGDRVRRGQLLFALDRSLLQAAQAKAQAEVLSARAVLAVAEAGSEKAVRGPRSEEVRMAQEAAAQAEAQVTLAQANWERSKKLRAAQALSEAEIDEVRTSLATATYAEQEAAEHLRLLRRGTRAEDKEAARAGVAAARARVAVADAALRQAEIELERSQVRAPFDGAVVRRWRDPGAMLATGTAVLTLMNPATLHVAANVEEKYLAEIHVGRSVTIDVDAYPHHGLRGHVTRILRATNSEFSMIPAEGVSGTFIKVTQRVPIWIDFDRPPALPLSPGLSVEVRILRPTHASPRRAAARR